MTDEERKIIRIKTFKEAADIACGFCGNQLAPEYIAEPAIYVSQARDPWQHEVKNPKTGSAFWIECRVPKIQDLIKKEQSL